MYLRFPFDPKDVPDHGLTVDWAQQLGEQFCKEHFPGHHGHGSCYATSLYTTLMVTAAVAMSMTTAFTIFAKKAVRENAIPFVVSAYKDPPTISLTEEELDRLLIRVLLKKEEWDAQAKETDSSVEDFIPDDEITEIEE